MWKRNHSLPEQIERGLVMNENLFRPQFDTLKLSDKLWLMQTLATRYNLTFKELYAFSRWGQSCTTGLFEKGGREFVFVPGDTVILGWESFVQGMDKANQEELADIFAEIEYEGSVEEFLRQGMTPASPLIRTGWRTCRSWRAGTARALRSTKRSALNAMVIAGGRGCAIQWPTRSFNGPYCGSWQPAFPRRMSGPICAEADAAPCFPGGMDWTTR